jgi:hypothetical protein
MKVHDTVSVAANTVRGLLTDGMHEEWLPAGTYRVMTNPYRSTETGPTVVQIQLNHDRYIVRLDKIEDAQT